MYKKHIVWAWVIIGLVVLIGAVVVALVADIIRFSGSQGSASWKEPEVLMPVVIVAAVAVLLILLYTVALGFSGMGLTDPKQALGLPEGSIRSLIALMLIMVFIIFGIYLFGAVGRGFYDIIRRDVTLPEANAVAAGFPGRAVPILETSPSSGRYNVWIKSEIADDGARLAQQLITTVGTLVVAVSGFYFGSSTARARRGTESSLPSIQSMSPTEGTRDTAALDVTILGTNFRSPRTVQLVRNNEKIVGTDVTFSPTMIRCKFKLDKTPGEPWDLVVENENGDVGRLARAFNIQ